MGDKKTLINNAILCVTTVALTLGLYSMGAGGWAGFGFLPMFGVTYWRSKEEGKGSK